LSSTAPNFEARFGRLALTGAALAILVTLLALAWFGVGRPLPDVRSPSLKRGWVPFEQFAHWERWQ